MCVVFKLSRPSQLTLFVGPNSHKVSKSLGPLLVSESIHSFFSRMKLVTALLLYPVCLVLCVPLRALVGASTSSSSSTHVSSQHVPVASSPIPLPVYFYPDTQAPNDADQRGQSVSPVPTLTVVTSPSSTTSSITSSSPLNQDMATVLQRRLGFITASATQLSHIASWYVAARVVCGLKKILTMIFQAENIGT